MKRVRPAQHRQCRVRPARLANKDCKVSKVLLALTRRCPDLLARLVLLVLLVRKVSRGR